MITHNRISRSLAFTLIELLVVIAIIASLISLLLPSLAAVKQRANSLKCISNMRQLGVSVNLYIIDHNNRTPVIEPWPDKPEYTAADGAQTLKQAFGPYGITDAVLQCPADVSGTNYYKKEGASYQWFPMASGQNTQSIKGAFFMGNNGTITMSRLILAFDYSAVHNGNSNVLFGDGHVATSN